MLRFLFTTFFFSPHRWNDVLFSINCNNQATLLKYYLSHSVKIDKNTPYPNKITKINYEGSNRCNKLSEVTKYFQNSTSLLTAFQHINRDLAY